MSPDRNIPYPGGMGDLPEDLPVWWRDYIMKMTGLLPKKPLDVLLRDLADVFIMAPQNIVPVFAKPFKETTPPDGFELPPQEEVVPPPQTYIDVVNFTVPPGRVGIVTSVHQELESLGAYADVGVRLMWQGSSDEWWNPQKPETMSTRIIIFEKDSISIQMENTSDILTHYGFAEICGYTYPVNQPGRDQFAITPDTGYSRER